MPRYQHPITNQAPKRHFIAGAVCPKCAALDTMLQVTTADDEWAECVQCGHVERRPSAESVKAKNAIESQGLGVVKFKQH